MFSACFCPRDHPRACGEHLRKSKNLTQREGSSPRLRGTLLVACSTHFRSGIIPALAGNTHRRSLLAHGSGDHPRACGEHWIDDYYRAAERGSSPRLRGTLVVEELAYFSPGIIPALAGNTSPRWRWWGRHGDHPRACGEHQEQFALRAFVEGSSPRLRGTLLMVSSGWELPGIIPALAGNTATGSGLPHATRDHPRACGEHEHLMSIKDSGGGSSPRLRGTHDVVGVRERPVGIIPALAGNTAVTTPTESNS